MACLKLAGSITVHRHGRKKKAAIAAAWSEHFQGRGTQEEVVTRRLIFLISNVMTTTRRCVDVVACVRDGGVNDHIVINLDVFARAA
jgi:hypothetical protein